MEMIMKKYLMAVAVLLILVGPAWASRNVKLAWDPPAAATDVGGYRVYQSQAPGGHTFGKENAVLEVGVDTRTVTLVVEDGTWYWVVTAVDLAQNESGPSNEVSKLVDGTAPDPPQGLIARILEIILSWLRGINAT
jgi:hypothetical protein